MIAAANSGRHVLSEKPLATTPRDAWEMVAAAKAAGTTLAIMHNYLFFSEVARTLELIAAGEIGPVEVAILNWLGVPDSPGNAAYRPSWRHDPQAGGRRRPHGHAPHRVPRRGDARRADRAGVGVGHRPDGRRPGRGHRARPVRDRPMRPRSSTSAGASGWAGSRCRGPAGPDRGHLPRRRATAAGRRSSGSSSTAGAAGREVTDLPFIDGSHPLIADLADAIRAGRPPIATGAQGAHILEATLAVYASAATGRTWDLPLDAGQPRVRARCRRPGRARAGSARRRSPASASSE